MTSSPSQTYQTQPKWGQHRRLEFIDFRLRWDGHINRSDLTEFFNISVPQASLDISRYLELVPGNASYDRSSKIYIASENFSPQFSRNSPERYLSELIARANDILQPEHSYIGWLPPVATVPSPTRSIPAKVLIPILLAIRRKTKVLIKYQSMSSLAPSERLISPHAIAHDGFRWHVRAYCERRKDYIDFVVARILDIALADSPGVSGDEDSKWHNIVSLVLCANPALGEAHRRVIELDYGMTAGEVALDCRQALLYYALKRLGLLNSVDAKPEQQQIALKNFDEIAEFLPKSSDAR